MPSRRKDVVELFADWMTDGGLGAQTVDGYSATIRRLRKAKGPLDRITEGDLLSYQRERLRTVKETTWNRDVFAIAKFFGWRSTSLETPDPSRALKPRKAAATTRARRIEGLPSKIASLTSPDARAIAKLIYFTGVSVAQALQLAQRRGTLGSEVSVGGRKGKPKTVHLTERTELLIQELSRSKLRSRRFYEKAFEKQGMTGTAIAATRRHHEMAPSFEVLLDHPELEKVVTALESARAQLRPGGHPDRAIGDAAIALQELLTAMPQVRGGDLGALFKSALSEGYFGGHDASLGRAIKALVDWVNADRDKRGVAHRVRTPSPDDAWLTFRVVEAIVMRLEKEIR